MLHLQCPGCHTSAYVGCGCPDGHDPGSSGHLPGCAMSNLGNAVVCPPNSGCCAEDHGPGGHDGAANACSGEHDGDHGKDNPDCTVCRPITITVMPGYTRLQPVAGG